MIKKYDLRLPRAVTFICELSSVMSILGIKVVSFLVADEAKSEKREFANGSNARVLNQDSSKVLLLSLNLRLLIAFSKFENRSC